MPMQPPHPACLVPEEPLALVSSVVAPSAPYAEAHGDPCASPFFRQGKPRAADPSTHPWLGSSDSENFTACLPYPPPPAQKQGLSRNAKRSVLLSHAGGPARPGPAQRRAPGEGRDFARVFFHLGWATKRGGGLGLGIGPRRDAGVRAAWGCFRRLLAARCLFPRWVSTDEPRWP